VAAVGLLTVQMLAVLAMLAVVSAGQLQVRLVGCLGE
jgi:hypothetical protein